MKRYRNVPQNEANREQLREKIEKSAELREEARQLGLLDTIFDFTDAERLMEAAPGKDRLVVSTTSTKSILGDFDDLYTNFASSCGILLVSLEPGIGAAGEYFPLCPKRLYTV